MENKYYQKLRDSLFLAVEVEIRQKKRGGGEGEYIYIYISFCRSFFVQVIYICMYKLEQKTARMHYSLNKAL